MSDLPVPTRDDLARLLAAKDAADKAYSDARFAKTLGQNESADHRLTLDIAERVALKAYCVAQDAYSAALDRFSAAKVAEAA